MSRKHSKITVQFFYLSWVDDDRSLPTPERFNGAVAKVNQPVEGDTLLSSYVIQGNSNGIAQLKKLETNRPIEKGTRTGELEVLLEAADDEGLLTSPTYIQYLGNGIIAGFRARSDGSPTVQRSVSVLGTTLAKQEDWPVITSTPVLSKAGLDSIKKGSKLQIKVRKRFLMQKKRDGALYRAVRSVADVLYDQDSYVTITLIEKKNMLAFYEKTIKPAIPWLFESDDQFDILKIDGKNLLESALTTKQDVDMPSDGDWPTAAVAQDVIASAYHQVEADLGVDLDEQER